MRAPSEDSPILGELDGWEEGSYPPNQLWEPLAKWWHRCIHQSDPFLSGWNTNVFVHKGLEVFERKVVLFIFVMIIMYWDYFLSRPHVFCPYLWSRGEGI